MYVSSREGSNVANLTRKDRKSSWKIILENHGGLSFLSQCNRDINSLEINDLPLFYHEILKHWQKTKAAFQKDTPPQNKIIWNNRNIRVNGKPLVYKSWFEKHIVHIKTSSKTMIISFLLLNFPKNST